jgi:hypothetical protein
MADILIHSTVPSLHTQTESASNLILDTPSKNDSHSTNKYNGHVTRLRNVFTNQSLTADNHLKSKSMINNRQFYRDDIPYTMIQRKYSNSDQHYDFPADAVEQLKKQQRDENEMQIIPSFLPSNVLRRMNHLNTIFVKPTKIERSLLKFDFENTDQSKSDESPILSGKQSDFITSTISLIFPQKT